ncbi:MAG: leucine-rich repeat domain-containing protein [Lachnoclostridium sp.]|nr:leucine-rich repeat domain-containing protein [Lachnoclostridium sp.]
MRLPFAAVILALTLACQAQSYFEIDGILYKEITKDPTRMQVRVLVKNEDGEPGTHYPSFYTGEVVIPATIEHDLDTFEVTQIQKMAFNGCEGMTSLTIGENVTEIPDYTLLSCPDLERVALKGVVRLGEMAINNLPKLSSLDLGDRLEKIGRTAISNLSALTTVKLPASLKTIDNNSFYNVESLTDVNLENVEIFSSCFHDVPLREINLKAAKSIRGAFNGIYNLHKIRFGNNLKRIISSFGGLFQQEVDLSATKVDSIMGSFGFAGEGMSKVFFPSTLKYISNSFSSVELDGLKFNSVGLVIKDSFNRMRCKKLVFGKEVSEVSGSFNNIECLEELVILPDCKASFDDCFDKAIDLKLVVFNDRFTQYPKWSSMDNLEDVYFSNPEPVGELPSWLRYRDKLTIHVPKGAAEAYNNSWHILEKQSVGSSVSIVEDTYRY